MFSQANWAARRTPNDHAWPPQMAPIRDTDNDSHTALSAELIGRVRIP
jgi:hypothetical protein